MRNVKMDLARFLVTTSIGAASTVTGCATSGAMTPAQARQVAGEECVGMPPKEREFGLLAYRDAIASVQTLKESEQIGKVKFIRDRGVMIALRAQPGMSAPWLGRVASCHMALAPSRGSVSSSSETDPLLVPGAAVRIEEAANGYLVSVRVPDGAAAEEALRRARGLLATQSGPATAQAASR